MDLYSLIRIQDKSNIAFKNEFIIICKVKALHVHKI